MDLTRFVILVLMAILTTGIVFLAYFLIKKLIKALAVKSSKRYSKERSEESSGLMANHSKIQSKYAIILVIILLIVALGYWFVVRPYFTVRNCKDVALSATGYTSENLQAWASNHDVQSKYAFVYGVCMQKEGINP